MPTYQFDTNAIQGIGRQVLMNCRAQGHRLIVSTISCFELVSHLDDANFRLARGNARKGLLCEILHDPLAEIMLDVGCQTGVHPGRLDDQPALVAILNDLEQSDTYAAFMLSRWSWQANVVLSVMSLAIFGTCSTATDKDL